MNNQQGTARVYFAKHLETKFIFPQLCPSHPQEEIGCRLCRYRCHHPCTTSGLRLVSKVRLQLSASLAPAQQGRWRAAAQYSFSVLTLFIRHFSHSSRNKHTSLQLCSSTLQLVVQAMSLGSAWPQRPGPVSLVVGCRRN